MRILSQAEQSLLTEYLLKESSNTVIGIFLSLYTGLRVGEVCALKWENISFRDNCIHVHKTMQRIQVKSNSDHISSCLCFRNAKMHLIPISLPEKQLYMWSHEPCKTVSNLLLRKQELPRRTSMHSGIHLPRGA